MKSPGYKNFESKFIYLPPCHSEPKAQNAKVGFRFAQNVAFLDPWGTMLLGKNRMQRIIFRLRHPFVYMKRWYFKVLRKVKSRFKNSRILCKREKKFP